MQQFMRGGGYPILNLMRMRAHIREGRGSENPEWNGETKWNETEKIVKITNNNL
jgi:hypothetical protein